MKELKVSEQANMRIDAELKRRAIECAKADYRTLSSLMEVALTEYINRHEKKITRRKREA